MPTATSGPYFEPSGTDASVKEIAYQLATTEVGRGCTPGSDDDHRQVTTSERGRTWAERSAARLAF